jgi:hypothetical protein
VTTCAFFFQQRQICLCWKKKVCSFKHVNCNTGSKLNISQKSYVITCGFGQDEGQTSKFLFLQIQNTAANNASTDVNDTTKRHVSFVCVYLSVCVHLCGYQPSEQQLTIAGGGGIPPQNCCSIYKLQELSAL